MRPIRLRPIQDKVFEGSRPRRLVFKCSRDQDKTEDFLQIACLERCKSNHDWQTLPSQGAAPKDAYQNASALNWKSLWLLSTLTACSSCFTFWSHHQLVTELIFDHLEHNVFALLHAMHFLKSHQSAFVFLCKLIFNDGYFVNITTHTKKTVEKKMKVSRSCS